jgi:hypothetical protein
MSTSIVIPLNNRSTQNNYELRMCLRSIEKHLTGVGQIFIIGHAPEWVTNITHIPYDEDPRNRYRDRNIMNKMLIACKDERVSNDFLMVHDDHFLLADFEAGAFPYYHCGPMVPNVGQYAETKRNTILALSIRDDVNHVINNYDTHCPILFNKERFMRSVALADWSKWYGYCIKTLYCVMNGIPAEKVEDLKIRMPLKADEIMRLIKGRGWFSIGDRCFKEGGMKEVLEQLYQNKSRYER